MESHCQCRFVLLDFGHPMTDNSIRNIIHSLENVLSLGLTFSRFKKKKPIGISILNSDFMFLESESHLRKNFQLISRNLNDLVKAAKANGRVTVQEYKYLLSSSIEAILRKFQKFNENNYCSESTNSIIQITVITKKTATVLADILANVAAKLTKNFQSTPSLENYKIVQVSSDQEQILRSSEDKLIKWILCPDNVYGLECFFKLQLLNQPQQLQIQLIEDLEVECEVEDCLINLMSGTLDSLNFFEDSQSKISTSHYGTLKPARKLLVLHRLPVQGLSPTFMCSFPRRIFAAQSEDPGSSDSVMNQRLFKGLCQELLATGQGLLAKSMLSTERGDSFYFITSNGDMLLMKDVVPQELHLPTRANSTGAVDSLEDDGAAPMIKACFEKIKYLDEYDPKDFSSGLYGFLKNYLAQPMQRKTSEELSDLDNDWEKTGRKWKTASDKTCICEPRRENQKKRPKPSSGAELENVHPALLSPNVVGKYRKIRSQAFHLPELSSDYQA